MSASCVLNLVAKSVFNNESFREELKLAVQNLGCIRLLALRYRYKRRIYRVLRHTNPLIVLLETPFEPRCSRYKFHTLLNLAFQLLENGQ
jgi:hypothetical protein